MTNEQVEQFQEWFSTVENRFYSGNMSVMQIAYQAWCEATKTAQPYGASTESGLYNCHVCGLEKCVTPGICNDCLTPPATQPA